MTTARDDLAKSEAILVAAIEVNVPELIIARTAIGDFQSMTAPKRLESSMNGVKPRRAVWSDRLTGNPKRVVTLGVNYAKGKAPISYAWQAFVAPACDDYNNTFSKLEARIKPIIEALERREALTVSQYAELLDWLDKVRIGVWLLRGMIEKSAIAVDPNFHIASRMSRKDRMLAVYVFDSQLPVTLPR